MDTTRRYQQIYKHQILLARYSTLTTNYFIMGTSAQDDMRTATQIMEVTKLILV